jgi:hypothetical protein
MLAQERGFPYRCDQGFPAQNDEYHEPMHLHYCLCVSVHTEDFKQGIRRWQADILAVNEYW